MSETTQRDVKHSNQCQSITMPSCSSVADYSGGNISAKTTVPLMHIAQVLFLSEANILNKRHQDRSCDV